MIYVVSGFMRSGTSAMMQALESGGLEVAKSAQRDRLNEAYSDDFYKPNPVSLYEPSLKEMRVLGWPRQYEGKLIKVVAPFLKFLSVHEYSVIFMRRNAEEIRQSYFGAFNSEIKIDYIENCIKESLLTLKNRRDVKEIIEINYKDMISNPLEIFKSLKWPINPQNSANVINPELYRFRIERLTMGL